MRKNHTSSDATLKWQQCIKFESLESLDNNFLDILSIFKKFVVKYKLRRYQINIRTFLRFLLIAQTMGVCTQLRNSRNICLFPSYCITHWSYYYIQQRRGSIRKWELVTRRKYWIIFGIHWVHFTKWAKISIFIDIL